MPSPATESAEPAEAASKKRRMSGWRELPILIVVALTVALVIKSFVVQPFWIPSSSMEDTLMVYDRVLVNKLVCHFRSIQRGDIIVFNGDGSWNPNPLPAKPPFSRRMLAMPGTRVCRDPGWSVAFALEWERGKAWAFEQAMGAVWYYAGSNPAMSRMGQRTLERIGPRTSAA
jgi:hypothetical protein